MPNSQKGFSPILIILLMVALVVFLIYNQSSKKISHSQQDKSQTQIAESKKENKLISDKEPSLACSSKKYLTDYYNSLSNKNDLFIYNLSNPFTTAEWKRNKDEPYIGYLGSYSTLYFRKDTFDNVKQLLKDNLLDNLTNGGFVIDKLNTSSNEKSEQYGYRKEQTIYTISLASEKYTFDPEFPQPVYAPSFSEVKEIPVLTIYCANIDSKIDALYTELLSTPVVREELVSSSGKNGPKLVVYTIDKVHSNNIIHASIGSRDWGGGYSFWIIKENGAWKKLYTGQQLPECSLLESLKIEPGVDCLDPSLKEIYRKTK